MAAKNEGIERGEYVMGIAMILSALLISASLYTGLSNLEKAVSALKLTVTVPAAAAAQPAAAAAQPAAQQPSQAAPAVKATISASMTANSVAQGPAGAKVTVVEFSDFQCPYCSKALPMLKAAMDKYPNQAKLYYKHYPLSFHQYAQKAAEAAECAKDQGKFWEMHDAMFADQSKLAVADLKATAATLGLDATKFNTCLDSGTKASAVSKDAQDGSQLGVSGTPTFYINGAQVVGADATGIMAAMDAAMKG